MLAQDPYPVVQDGPEDDGPLWSSEVEPIDPRWAKLKDIELG